MNARMSGAPRRGLAAAISDFVIEPATQATPAPTWAGRARPVAAVVGLRRGIGATTLARALAAQLAIRDAGGAAVVTTEALTAGGVPFGTLAAGRLSRAVTRTVPHPTRAIGRICLVECAAPADLALAEATRQLAPLVFDVSDPSCVPAAASLADAVVVVAIPDVEPALVSVVSQSLTSAGHDPIVVLNRDLGDDDRWNERASVRLPDSRLAARLALGGRETRGAYGLAVAELAQLVVPPAP